MNACVVGLQGQVIAYDLAKKLNIPLYHFFSDYFADTESNMHIPDASFVADKFVIIVYQFSPSNREAGGAGYTCINHQLLNLFFLIRKLRHHKAAHIVLALPYLPYSRQEKKTNNESISLFELTLSLFKDIGVNVIITCDVHTKYLQSDMLYEVSFTSFWGSFLRSYLLKKSISLENVCIASPDQGGFLRAQGVADALGLTTVCMHKKRIEKDCVVMQSIAGDVAGKIVIIIDDILDTGKTAVQACNTLREHGATRIIGCFSHAVLASGSLARLSQSCFDEIFISNSLSFDMQGLPDKVHVVPIESFLVQEVEYYVSHFLVKGISCNFHAISSL